MMRVRVIQGEHTVGSAVKIGVKMYLGQVRDVYGRVAYSGKGISTVEYDDPRDRS